MGGLFGGQQAHPMSAPSVPTIDSAEVQKQAQDQLKRRAQAQGRASNLLTDPSFQMEPELNQQKMALG